MKIQRYHWRYKRFEFPARRSWFDTFAVSRNKENVSINYFGQQLLKLGIAAKLRILNSRTRVDLQGHITYFGFSRMQHSRFGFGVQKSFKVFFNSVHFSSRLKNLLSDNKPILSKISNNNLLETNKNPINYILEERPPKYHWDSFSIKSYEKDLADRSNHFVRHYYNVNIDCRSNINYLIEDIVSSAQKFYIYTLRITSWKKFVNVKRTMRYTKTKNGSTKCA